MGHDEARHARRVLVAPVAGALVGPAAADDGADGSHRRLEPGLILAGCADPSGSASYVHGPPNTQLCSASPPDTEAAGSGPSSGPATYPSTDVVIAAVTFGMPFQTAAGRGTHRQPVMDVNLSRSDSGFLASGCHAWRTAPSLDADHVRQSTSSQETTPCPRPSVSTSVPPTPSSPSSRAATPSSSPTPRARARRRRSSPSPSPARSSSARSPSARPSPTPTARSARSSATWARAGSPTTSTASSTRRRRSRPAR